MKTYITVTKKSLFALFLFTLVAILISGQFYAAGNRTVNAKTNAQRVRFIESLGLTPDDSNYSQKSVRIPETFSDVYENYNDLQKSAGYNLSAYKGANVEVFSYPVGKIKGEAGDEFYINLMVYEDCIIGGDISSRNFYGEMMPLVCVNTREKG